MPNGMLLVASQAVSKMNWVQSLRAYAWHPGGGTPLHNKANRLSGAIAISFSVCGSGHCSIGQKAPLHDFSRFIGSTSILQSGRSNAREESTSISLPLCLRQFSSIA